MSSPQLMVIADNLRSAYNVGSLFRTCDAAGVNTLFLLGLSAHPPHPKLIKTALGSTQSVQWEYHEDSLALIDRLKQSHTQIISLEPISTAVSIYDIGITSNTCLVLGNEVTGISQAILEQSHLTAQIPQFGRKDSLNVAVAAGIAIYEFRRKILTSSF